MALIFSEKPCKVGGGIYDKCSEGSTGKVDRNVVDSGMKAQAVIVNSGIANALYRRRRYEIL